MTIANTKYCPYLYDEEALRMLRKVSFVVDTIGLGSVNILLIVPLLFANYYSIQYAAPGDLVNLRIMKI